MKDVYEEIHVAPYINKILQFGSDYSNCQFFCKFDDEVYEVNLKASSLGEAGKTDNNFIKSYSTEKLTPDNWQWPILMAKDNGTSLVVGESSLIKPFIKANKPIKAALDDMAQIIGESAQICSYKVEKISEAFSKSSGVLIDCELENNDDEALDTKEPVLATMGRNLFEAFVARTVLEKSAFVNYKGELIGGVKFLDNREVKKMREFYLDSYSKPELDEIAGTTTAQIEKDDFDFDEEEKSLREKIIKTGCDLLELNLVQGTWGNISARLDEEYVLCTPSGIDYKSLSVEDIAKVNLATGKYEGTKKPTSEMTLHTEIYKAREDVNAIVHTHSTYCSIFAAARMPLQLFNEADIEEYGELFHVADYALPGTDELAISTNEALGTRRGALMANHGMVGCHEDLDKALDVCKAMELGAKVFIDNKGK